MWRAAGILILLSAALFAALTLWTNHTTAATHERSHAFVQDAKSICEHASGPQQAAEQLSRLAEPPNVHRAVVRLELHWHRLAALRPGTKAYRAEVKQARLAADLLNIKACASLKSGSS